MRTLWCAVMLCAVWTVQGQENRLRNAGFERGGGVLADWSVPAYWSGAVEPATGPGEVRTGARAARLRTAEKGGRWWGRVLQAGPGEPRLGSRCRLSVWARGKGELLLGVIRYTAPVPGQPNYHYLWMEQPATLADAWQEVVFEFAVLDPAFVRLATAIELRGEGGMALLDDAAFVEVVPEGVVSSLLPGHPMVAVGSPVALRFAVARHGAAQPGEVMVQIAPPDGEPTTATAAIGVGQAELAHAFVPDRPGIWRATFVHLGLGVSESVFVDALPPEPHAAFAAAAQDLALPDGPCHILFLGDSLTDFLRGRNYVDKVGFWLRQQGGARCGVRNAGVGGDTITRVWDRLNGKPGTHRLAMYEGLFEPRPQRVFVFLGHNDSKTSSATGYQTHCVAPDDFRDLYRRTVAKIQADTGARVTIVSATSSVYEITKAAAEKRAAEGRAHSLFGEPAHLEAFNRIAREIASELGCDYVDVYQPTRDHPRKEGLFSPDGVHLSNEGNRLVALEILRSLGKRAGKDASRR